MVDVGGKPETQRVATAEATVTLSAEAMRRVQRSEIAKGDVLAVARIAGIQAAKETFRLIPLCHPIPLDRVRVALTLEPAARKVRIESEVATRAATGVEMEAMTAAGIAALTVYDMCKGVDKGAAITGLRLLTKSGGKSGSWKRGTVKPASAGGITKPASAGGITTPVPRAPAGSPRRPRRGRKA